MADTISDIHYMGYAYQTKLTAGPVANNGTVALPAPGICHDLELGAAQTPDS